MTRSPLYMQVSSEDIPEVAVAISVAEPYIHAGIIYRSESGQRLLVDLRIDGSFGSSPPKPRFAWAIPNVEPELLRQVAILCESIADEPQPPCVYYVKYAPSSFTSDGASISFGKGTVGLTCATFVLTVFHSFGINLVDYDTWELRPEDERWEAEIVENMTSGAYGIAVAEVAEQNAEAIPCFRYSPVDVIASCRADTIPISFQEATLAGDEIRRWIGDLSEIVSRRRG